MFGVRFLTELQRGLRLSVSAALIAFVPTSCIASSQITSIVLSVGSCGGSPCEAYQVALLPNNTYSYTIYPHRRIFTGRADFYEAARDLVRSPFFRQSNPETGGHGNWPDEITIYAKFNGGARQISVIPKDANYAAYRAFAQAVSAPVLQDVLAQRLREERTLRDPQGLLSVSVWHEPLLRCGFYKAVFNRTGNMTIEFAPPYLFTEKAYLPVRRSIAARVPFSLIKDLIERDRVASLYEDYPTMGADQGYLNVTLTYKTSTYGIKAAESKFWPSNLQHFISRVDALALNQIPNGRRVCSLRATHFSPAVKP
jgi:hypothetical protein